jgi:hypothetical protein
MSKVMLPYVVRQGDYLAKLAFVQEFDADDVWKDPKNEALAKLRPDPNLLAPGDILYVPEKKAEEGLDIAKGAENNYNAKVPLAEVTLTFQDDDGKPIAGEDYEVLGLTGDGATPPKDKTRDDGVVVLKVPVTTREVSVAFPRLGATYVARIGDMDPQEETTGIVKRLANLGFYQPDPAVEMDEETALRGATLAFQRFQRQQAIDPTGLLDEATKKALLDEHGL